MHKIHAAMLVAVLLIPAPGLAQNRSIWLSPALGGEMVSRDAVPLAVLRPAARQRQPRERSWPGRHPVLVGALVGLGVGLGLEAAVIPGGSGGEPHSAYIPMFAGSGAGIGALVGLIVSSSRKL